VPTQTTVNSTQTLDTNQEPVPLLTKKSLGLFISTLGRSKTTALPIRHHAPKLWASIGSTSLISHAILLVQVTHAGGIAAHKSRKSNELRKNAE